MQQCFSVNHRENYLEKYLKMITAIKRKDIVQHGCVNYGTSHYSPGEESTKAAVQSLCRVGMVDAIVCHLDNGARDNCAPQGCTVICHYVTKAFFLLVTI